MSDLSKRIQGMSSVKLAFAAEQLASKYEILNAEPIAIIGIGCRFPGGADNPESYWKFLESATEVRTEVPASRWDINDYYASDPDAPGKMYCRYGAFLDNVYNTDAHFFGISPREAVTIDPQHRLLLEVAWEALEHAGIPAEGLYGTPVGVFAGISTFEYAAVKIGLNNPAKIDAYYSTGGYLSMCAGRLSYTFGFTGPCMSIDTACSSSLVAVHLAGQSLRRRECSLALAGGVNLLLSPELSISFSKARMLSPEGRCKTFDAGADGYVRGEGCGVVVLKRLSDALSDGDNVLALIRCSAVNQDGPSGGLTVPSGPSQERIIRRALSDSGIEPTEVSYIEAHGTGTSLGDPIEVGALGAVFKNVKTKSDPLLIGSVKTNFGHTEAASGVAGLIKVVLSMQHGKIPPHLHFKSPSPHIDWAALPIEVTADGHIWSDKKKIAGVSSFGASGTNAHVVLEEAPQHKKVDSELNRTVHILTLSAKTDESLSNLSNRYKEILPSSDVTIRDLCYTANIGRNHFAKRRFAIGETADEFINGLSETQEFQLHEGHTKIAFLFTGQGGLTSSMGRSLYESSPIFRDTLTECDKILRKYIDVPLLELMYGGVSAAVINETRYTQPVLFCLEYSLYKLWQSWGIEPGALLGHSIGEYTAACVSGVFSLEDALMLVAKRGHLMWEAPGEGTMAAVFASETLVLKELTSDNVSIAAVNGIDSVVISGLRNSVMETCKHLSGRGIKSKELVVSHGFHSHLMEPVLDSFAKTADTVVYNKGKIPVVSNVNGEYYSGEKLSADYWVKHIRGTVRFFSGIETLYNDGYRVFVELGPASVLLGMGKRCINDKATAWFPSLRTGQNDWRQMLKSLGELYVCGMDINWRNFNEPYGYRKVAALPTYPFARKHYQIDMSKAQNVTELKWKSPGKRMMLPMSTEIRFESVFRADSPSYIPDHRIFGRLIVAGASHISMVIQAAKEVFGGGHCKLEDFVFQQPVVVPEDGSVNLQLILTPLQKDSYTFQLVSASTSDSNNETWSTHISGKLEKSNPEVSNSHEVMQIEKTIEGWQEINIEEFYEEINKSGHHLGASFLWNKRIWYNKLEAFNKMQCPQFDGNAYEYLLYPGLIDSCVHYFCVKGPEAVFGKEISDTLKHEYIYIPFSIERVDFYQPPVSRHTLWCHTIFKDSDKSIKSITGDIRLIDETGVVIAQFMGFTARQFSRASIALNDSHDNFIYETDWEKKEIEQSAELPDSTWAIFTGKDGVGKQLSSLFKENGIKSIIVQPGTAYSELSDGKGYEINAQSVGDFEKLFATCGKLSGVVYLWSARVSGSEYDADHVGVIGLLHTVQMLVKHGNAKLMIVTRGVWSVGENEDNKSINPAQAPVWGFGRVMFLEHPELNGKLVDLATIAGQDESLFFYNELFYGGKEQQVAMRDGSRFVCRLKRRKSKTVGRVSVSENTVLRLSDYGRLDKLELKPVERKNPSENEVEIEVKSAGLNFRDVLNALGMLIEYTGIKVAEDMSLGFECCGVVSRIGKDVKGIKPGDSVIAAPVKGAFSTYTTASSSFTVPMPENISYDEAATIPTYLTAWYALIELCRLKSGDRILIHSAAGGVGLAAVNIAKMVGAEIYATASRGKWDFLRAQGVSNIMDSRSLDFSDEIMALTHGNGVNVVLNSLNGDYISKSLRVLSNGGCFIEIGKLGIWTEEDVKRHRPDVSYYSFDMGEVSQRNPSAIRDMLMQISSHVSTGKLKPLFHKVFPITDAESAFRYMAAAKHTGKVVINMSNASLNEGIIHSDATYLITGGLGALGLELSHWLVEHGARHIALTGRSNANEKAREKISQLKAQGVTVMTISADVSVMEDVVRLFSVISETMPPVRGIIHAAGVLDDSMILNQSVEKFQKVMKPKVSGTWNLHLKTIDMNLDFFVCFSSVAALIGSKGQSNYAAANVFMDALMRYRRSLGYPGLSINWGAWGDVGMASQLGETEKARLERQGIGSIALKEGLKALESLITENAINAAVIPIDWGKYETEVYAGEMPPFFDSVRKVSNAVKPTVNVLSFSDELIKLPTYQHLQRITAYVRQQVSAVLALDSSQEIGLRERLFDAGIDSLMAIELRNRLEAGFKRTLSATLVFDYPTVEALVKYLHDSFSAVSDKPVIKPNEPQPEEISSDISDDDIARQLAEELKDIDNKRTNY
ncbi:SDR family NAD(P)-dependent oxidoreductase [Candidatus Magnetomonas plexicatena]|uniref:SDR family NAD(P)-dependent oxidoreductase n=1 Tax=Candidatus Magnetomonas plexicatena TaxID=2552947 RepID=UPI001C74FEC5|nr:SDR family NAD(P)-dependent oxidoreductase [Nitrospirales bacterium LBB_01]